MGTSMQKNRAFFFVILALLALLVAPITAHAQAMLTGAVDVTGPANPCDQTSPGANLSSVDFSALIKASSFAFQIPNINFGGAPSPTSSKIDQAYQQASVLAGQAFSKDIKTAWASYNKIDAAADYCVIRIIQAYQLFISMMGINPIIGALIAIATNIIMGILNSVCSAVLSTVNTLEQSISALTRICIPIPAFGLNLNFGIKVPTCTGGTGFSLIGFNNPNALHPFSNQNSIPAGQ